MTFENLFGFLSVVALVAFFVGFFKNDRDISDGVSYAAVAVVFCIVVLALPDCGSGTGMDPDNLGPVRP